MQVEIDPWFLDSVFTHVKIAASLVDNMGDTVVADELAKTLTGICRRVAEILGEPYGPTWRPVSWRSDLAVNVVIGMLMSHAALGEWFSHRRTKRR